MLTAEYQISLLESHETVGSITADHFGSIIINKFGANTHIEQVLENGLSFFRFPGGTLAEHANVIEGSLILNDQIVSFDMLQGDRSDIGFDLTHPELISPNALFEDGNPDRPNDIISFSTALQFAVANDTDFNLIIPVQRYFIDRDFRDPEVVRSAQEMARQDALVFAERLKAGDYNDGILPDTLLIDIGNEPYNDPFAYAIIAKVFLETLNEALSGTDINYELGFQMGGGSNRHRQLLEDGYFAKYLPDGLPAIGALSGFEGGDQSLIDFESRITIVDEAMLYILGDTAQLIDYVRHHSLAVDVNVLQDNDALYHQREQIVDLWQSAINETPDYYISAWTTDASNAENSPYSLAGAVNILALFRNFAETDVDRAALWGLVGSFNYDPAGMLPTVISDNNSDLISPSLAVLDLMSDNVANSNLLSIGSELELSDESSNDFLLFVYEKTDSFTLYVTAGELNGDELTVSLDLDNVVLPSTITTQHIEVFGGDVSGQALVTDVNYAIRDGKLRLIFDQDFEIVQVVIPKDTGNKTLAENYLLQRLLEFGILVPETTPLIGDSGDNVIVGSSEGDIIFGRDGDDFISGGGGRVQYFGPLDADSSDLARDFIFAGAGNDTLIGNDGADFLSGEQGNDLLSGGGGSDTFVFTEGHDTILDFNFRVDQIVIDSTLINGSDRGHENLADLATINNDTIVFNFNEENSLTIDMIDDTPASKLFFESFEIINF